MSELSDEEWEEISSESEESDQDTEAIEYYDSERSQRLSISDLMKIEKRAPKPAVILPSVIHEEPRMYDAGPEPIESLQTQYNSEDNSEEKYVSETDDSTPPASPPPVKRTRVSIAALMPTSPTKSILRNTIQPQTHTELSTEIPQKTLRIQVESDANSPIAVEAQKSVRFHRNSIAETINSAKTLQKMTLSEPKEKTVQSLESFIRSLRKKPSETTTNDSLSTVAKSLGNPKHEEASASVFSPQSVGRRIIQRRKTKTANAFIDVPHFIYGTIGIANPGKSSYMIAAIQCLGHTTKFREWIFSLAKSFPRDSFLWELNHVFDLLWTQSCEADTIRVIQFGKEKKLHCSLAFEKVFSLKRRVDERLADNNNAVGFHSAADCRGFLDEVLRTIYAEIPNIRNRKEGKLSLKSETIVMRFQREKMLLEQKEKFIEDLYSDFSSLFEFSKLNSTFCSANSKHKWTEKELPRLLLLSLYKTGDVLDFIGSCYDHVKDPAITVSISEMLNYHFQEHVETAEICQSCIDEGIEDSHLTRESSLLLCPEIAIFSIDWNRLRDTFNNREVLFHCPFALGLNPYTDDLNAEVYDYRLCCVVYMLDSVEEYVTVAYNEREDTWFQYRNECVEEIDWLGGDGEAIRCRNVEFVVYTRTLRQ